MVFLNNMRKKGLQLCYEEKLKSVGYPENLYVFSKVLLNLYIKHIIPKTMGPEQQWYAVDPGNILLPIDVIGGGEMDPVYNKVPSVEKVL